MEYLCTAVYSFKCKRHKKSQANRLKIFMIQGASNKFYSNIKISILQTWLSSILVVIFSIFLLYPMVLQATDEKTTSPLNKLIIDSSSVNELFCNEWTYSVEAKTNQVSFDVKNKVIMKGDISDLSEMLKNIREKLPQEKIKAGSHEILCEWQKLMIDNNIVVYDILNDIKETKKEINDFSENEEGEGSLSGTHYRLLSIIGPYISYSNDYMLIFKGAAHPSINKAYITYDINTKAPIKLLDLVDRDSLFHALKNDTYLKRLMHNSNENLPEKTQKDFDSSKNMQELNESLISYPFAQFAWEPSLTNFAVYDYDSIKNKVAIRIGVGYNNHVAHAFTELGVWVTPTVAFQALLNKAKMQQEGIFLKDLLNKRNKVCHK